MLRKVRAVESSSVSSAARIVGIFRRTTGSHSLSVRMM